MGDDNGDSCGIGNDFSSYNASGRYPRTSGRYSETRPLLNNGTNKVSPQDDCLSVVGCFLGLFVGLLALGFLIIGVVYIAKGKTFHFIILFKRQLLFIIRVCGEKSHSNKVLRAGGLF